MKKILVLTLVSVFSCLASGNAFAQYARRDVRPPVTETAELDPSTPLGKVREIAERLEKIEATTEEIGRALEANKIPDYKTSIDEILEASGATRAAVAQLGDIASGVRYVADVIETIEGNTAAIGVVAENVATTAQYLSYVPTVEQVDAKLGALETSIASAFSELRSANETAASANLAAFEKFVDEKIALAQTASTEDAEALKKKLETASNVIVLLGLVVLASLVLNVAKWVADKKRESDAERKALEEAVYAATRKSGASKKV